MLGFAADGQGPHALLWVEKTGANTGWVVAELARAAGVALRDAGVCGHKDRHAIARQAVSLPVGPGVDPSRWIDLAGEGYRVLSVERHGRKLRAGAHRGNRFRIRIRELAADRAGLQQRLERIAGGGVPNYFGPQRFGRQGRNLERARAWAEGRDAPQGRADRGFALSAARSLLYNEVLAGRVRAGTWDTLLDGEAVMLDGSRSFFAAASIDPGLRERCGRLDVHPSGPLWGRGESPAQGAGLEVEARVASAEPELVALLAAQGLRHERRSLRLPVREFRWSLAPDVLELEFYLPRGAFATAVVHELAGEAWDAGESADE